MLKSRILHQMHLDHVPTANEITLAILITAVTVFYLYILLVISYGPVFVDAFRLMVRGVSQVTGYGA
jgi:hypothetical protein